MGREINQIIAALRLSRLPGVGAAFFCDLIRRYGDPAKALAVWLDELPVRLDTLPVISQRKSPTIEGLAAAEMWLKSGGKAVWWGGPNYPAGLYDLSEPPPVLFIQGEIPNGRMVAIVGTRSAESYAISIAEKLAADLVKQGVAIVSGGAVGIDAAAHRSALDSKGLTVAVLGTGIDVVFPRGHADLFSRIARQGALVSELLPGTGPRRGFFPTRNRIIAALADETIVIQAPLRSGACITAKVARRIGRIIRVVVPPDTANPAWAGNVSLLKEGAIPFYII